MANLPLIAQVVQLLDSIHQRTIKALDQFISKNNQILNLNYNYP